MYVHSTNLGTPACLDNKKRDEDGAYLDMQPLPFPYFPLGRPQFAHPHPLQPLRPALDDAVEREADGVPSCDARVEHRPVDQGAVIVHLN